MLIIIIILLFSVDAFSCCSFALIHTQVVCCSTNCQHLTVAPHFVHISIRLLFSDAFYKNTKFRITYVIYLFWLLDIVRTDKIHIIASIFFIPFSLLFLYLYWFDCNVFLCYLLEKWRRKEKWNVSLFYSRNAIKYMIFRFFSNIYLQTFNVTIVKAVLSCAHRQQNSIHTLAYIHLFVHQNFHTHTERPFLFYFHFILPSSNNFVFQSLLWCVYKTQQRI